MNSVHTSEERRISEAIRAHARGAGRSVVPQAATGSHRRVTSSVAHPSGVFRVGNSGGQTGAHRRPSGSAHGSGVFRAGQTGGHRRPSGRAHATGVHRSASVPARSRSAPARPGFLDVLSDSRVSLLVAVLGGLLLGIVLALVSVLLPGALPAIG